MDWRGRVRGLGLVMLIATGVSAQTPAALRPVTAEHSRKVVSSGQAASRRPSPALVTNDDGLAILAAALESRGVAYRREKNSDCSHLVHAIYEHAGFPYAYAPSSDLYLGAEGFERVERAQPGDLVVWHGHAGIVVSPTQRTFFSALRTGIGVENYDSAYWMGRGRPRFFRYVKRSPAPVEVASSRAVSLKSADLHGPAPIEVLPTRTATVTPDEPTDDSAQRPAPQLAFSPPGVVVIRSVVPRPEQVRDALLVSFRDTAEGLESGDLFQLSSPLISFEDFQVAKVQRKGDHGWVELRMNSTDLIVGHPTRTRKPSQNQRWDLRRLNKDTWEVALPKDAVYLPHDLAVRVLSHHLAALSASDPGTAAHREKQAELARWLDVLLSGTRSR